MSCRSSMVTPGWEAVFWMRQVFLHRCHLVKGLRDSLAPNNGRKRYREHTSLIFCWSPSGCIHTRLMQTFKLSRVPSYAYPETNGKPTSRSESVKSAHNLGSTPSHIFPSSCKNSWNMVFAGSKILARAYAVLSAKLEKMIWRLTPSRYSTSHIKSSPCRFRTAL